MFQFGRKLMWASCLCTMAMSLELLMRPANAQAVVATSYGPCYKVFLNENTSEPENPLDCCLPRPKNEPKPFVMPVNPKLRVRQPAHVLAKDKEYVKKYNEAYRLMRALPRDDPRRFEFQWKTHCAFCNDAFMQRIANGTQENAPQTPFRLQVHFSWMFLPWHRMLIYFHEKILASLITDPDFTLPFWNWDNQIDEGANHIPSLFQPGFPIDNSELINKNRNSKHFPNVILDLNYDASREANESIPKKTQQEIIDGNLCSIYNQVVNKVSALEYLGGRYNVTGPTNFTIGESGGGETLHNTAHRWVGPVNDPGRPNSEDMGTFIFAGRDPIFYSHHCNVDRLWDVWKTLPDNVTRSGDRKRQDHKERDFLDSELTFIDENKEMVIVKIRDTLDSAKLGFTYNQMDSDKAWIKHKTKKSPPPPAKLSAEARQPSDYPEVDPNANNTISDVPICYKVARRAPNKTDLIGRSVKHVRQLTEQVVMENLKIPETGYVHLDAFIDQASANALTDVDQSDYVGTFSYLRNGLVNMSSPLINAEEIEEQKFRTLNVRFSISNSLAKLGITDYNTDITITIVPRITINGPTGLSFKSLKQDFQ